jgi:hypothetical protein
MPEWIGPATSRVGRALACIVAACALVSIEMVVLWLVVRFVGHRLRPYIDGDAAGDRLVYETIFVGIVAVGVLATAWASWVAGRHVARAPLAVFVTGAILVALREGISAMNDCLVGISFPGGHEGGCD